jgi:hypothetical protein
VTLRVIIPFLIASFCVAQSAAQKFSTNNSSQEPAPTGSHAEEFEQVVFPITELKLDLTLDIETRSGTGFCLDPVCRFIGTNYHVAMIVHPRKIKGEKVVQRYLATGPDDEGATTNEVASISSMKYNAVRDLAIFELRHPLRHYHGIPFRRNDLRIGQMVDIYSYPKEGLIHPRKILQVHGTYQGQTPKGLLAFDYDLSNGRTVRPGASGGIVVDRKTQQIVGVLNAIERSGEPIAFAVPVESLEEFVSRAQPYLAQTIFPSTKRISPISADLYPKFVPPSSQSLQHRPQEPIEVRVLRTKAQQLADSMRNFIAVQTLAWGSQDHEPLFESEYEVRVVDGYQRFRELPDGKKELQNVPFPPMNDVMVPGGEWSELPAMVGTDLDLKINQAADVVVNGRPVKVFQYLASAEDAVCRLKSVLDFGLFAISKTETVACYGEVWTDGDTNILRMSEHLELLGRWKDYQAVVTYGWLKKANETPRLIPLTIATQAERKKKVYWCRGQFADYQLFTSRARIIASTDPRVAQP